MEQLNCGISTSEKDAYGSNMQHSSQSVNSKLIRGNSTVFTVPTDAVTTFQPKESVQSISFQSADKEQNENSNVAKKKKKMNAKKEICWTNYLWHEVLDLSMEGFYLLPERVCFSL